MILVRIARFDMCSEYIGSSPSLAHVVMTMVHFRVQAPPATRSFVCHDGCSHASRKHLSCSVLFKISLAARPAVRPLD